MRRYVIIVAGGKGLRMGGDIPKQFLPIGGRPVLMRTVDIFRSVYPDIEVVLVLPKAQQDYWAELCRTYNFTTPVTVADGGETRFHSVLSGLRSLPSDESAVVGVHDGVRPFVSAETIRRCYETASEGKAVVPTTAVVETLRHILPDGTSVTRPRNEYRLVQTPQTFPLAMLQEAYEQTYRDAFTDDASVVEAMGIGITMIEGNRENIKLTTPADISLAEFIVQHD